jgi:hypothetical protein
VVTAALPTLLWIRQGHLDWDQAIAEGQLSIDGDAAPVRSLFRPDPEPVTTTP